MSALLSYGDALAALLRDILPTARETISVDAGAGRVLAAPVIARRAQPPAAMSAMDGYAVRSADVANNNSILSVIGESPAGQPYSGAVGEREAVRIFTGGVVPEGADRVVIQENVARRGDGAIEIAEAQTGATHIRSAGLDFEEGETLIDAGKPLTPMDVALAAAGNHAMIDVFRKPRICVFASGDELVEPGSTLTDASIINSASFGVAAMANAWGAAAVRGEILPDEMTRARVAIEQAVREFDVIIPVGGASVGDRDIMRAVFDDLGARLVFSKVAVKPGKPTWHARFDNGALVLGLPGNPASATVCAMLFAMPLIFTMTGRNDPFASFWRKARLMQATPSNGPRETFLRARLGVDGATLTVRASSRQDSSLLTPLADGDALIRRPANSPALEPGALVDVLPYGRTF